MRLEDVFMAGFLIFLCSLMSLVFAEITIFDDGAESFIMPGENNIDNSSVFCGNAICDAGEDCDNCMKDCGVCLDEGDYEIELILEYASVQDSFKKSFSVERNFWNDVSGWFGGLFG